MTDDRIIWNRMVAHVCERTLLQAYTVEAVMRAALEFLFSLRKEDAEG